MFMTALAPSMLGLVSETGGSPAPHRPYAPIGSGLSGRSLTVSEPRRRDPYGRHKVSSPVAGASPSTHEAGAAEFRDILEGIRQVREHLLLVRREIDRLYFSLEDAVCKSAGQVGVAPGDWHYRTGCRQLCIAEDLLLILEYEIERLEAQKAAVSSRRGDESDS